jgi:hypothetical protein
MLIPKFPCSLHFAVGMRVFVGMCGFNSITFFAKSSAMAECELAIQAPEEPSKKMGHLCNLHSLSNSLLLLANQHDLKHTPCSCDAPILISQSLQQDISAVSQPNQHDYKQKEPQRY